MSKRARPLEEKMKIVKAFKNGNHTISELEFIYHVRNVRFMNGYINLINKVWMD